MIVVVQVTPFSTCTLHFSSHTIQALSVSLEDESLDQETRQGMMRDVLSRLVQQSPVLWEDPLYQTLLEHGRPISPLDALLM